MGDLESHIDLAIDLNKKKSGQRFICYYEKNINENQSTCYLISRHWVWMEAPTLTTRGNLSQSLRLIKPKLPARWGKQDPPHRGSSKRDKMDIQPLREILNKLAMIIMTTAILGILFSKKLLFMPHTLNFLQCWRSDQSLVHAAFGLVRQGLTG